MVGRRSDQLTEAQRVCLRLVYSHHNSKEIAARTGVSPSAIDKRIERAIQLLGVATRFEAARLLHHDECETHHEAADVAHGPPSTSERLPSEPIDVPTPPRDPPPTAPGEPWGIALRFLGLSPASGISGRARVRSTRAERFVRLLLITVLVAVTSVALVSLSMTVTAMLRASRGEGPSVTAPTPAGASMGFVVMLKQRRQAAEIVTAQFLKTERSVDEAAEAAASCVSVLLQQRASANLPVSVGLDALQLVADASADLVRARRRLIEAHAALVAVRTEIGLSAFYGDESECPPNEDNSRRASGDLRLVAA